MPADSVRIIRKRTRCVASRIVRLEVDHNGSQLTKPGIDITAAKAMIEGMNFILESMSMCKLPEVEVLK